jgi:lambda family phage portal protein
MNFSLSLGKRSLRIQTGVQSPVAAAGPPKPMDRGPGSVRQNVGQRMYGAAQTSRLTQDWTISITSADAEILVSAIATRSRLRQLERDDDYFRNMLWLLENNVIGDQGIRLRMKARMPDGKLETSLNQAVEDAWNDYLSEENCCVSRDRNGIEVQRLWARCMARDGVFLLRKWRPFKNDYGYGVEPMEVDRLDHWWNRPAVGTANEIKFGMERDEFRAAVAYWILTRHPGDVFAYSATPRYRERVAASDVIGVWTIERAGQTIGMPLWPSVAKRLHNLYGYEESEQVAARAASAKGGWFKRDPKTAGADDYIGEEDSQGNKLIDTAPGQWEELPVGFDPIINDPKHPTDAFPHFVKSQLRGAAAGGYLPYNSVANDLESVNYSSYKAGMNDARDGYKWIQRLGALKLMRPWFRDWLKYALIAGKIKGATINDYDRLKVADYWKPRRWAGLEPLKETQAAVISIEAGLDSARNIIEEQYNRDIEEVYDDQEHDNELAKAHNLDFSAGEVHKPTVGAGQVDTNTSPDDKGDASGGLSSDDDTQATSAAGRSRNGNGKAHSLKFTNHR